ncbi:MAG: hypothetical protein JWP00_4246 [Chloroflexi bacterium]|jgi:hypothetical protein|nr:hypothetical protein [Chloroflexota bacterium]
MQENNEGLLDNDETILVMVHKRIRKRAGYDLDSLDITKALGELGYPLTEDEVLIGLSHLKQEGYLRAFEDTDESSRNGSRVVRYWGLEITPEGAMKAIDLMNQFRYGA